ncbi:MAG: RluA family pseudouridine synthase [Rhodoferax sp.]|nr:RluA family pseudouridine synthase [Rhodoferax sp.]
MRAPDAYSPPAGLEVVFSDAALIVLDKPSGLLSVPGRGDGMEDCLGARAQHKFPDALVVHRLDMATSGLIVMARGIATQRALSAAFAERQVYKRYEATVHGQIEAPLEAWRTIDLPIRVDWPHRPLRVIDATGQASISRVRLLAWNAAQSTSRVALEPETGRSHQLRVHLQAIGHPILGDALYAPAHIAAAAPRLLLHACALAFEHPSSHHKVEFQSPTPF